VAKSVEFLRDPSHVSSVTGTKWLPVCVAGARSAGLVAEETRYYEGKSEWLCVFGVGDPSYSAARTKHLAKGGRVICWDIGYRGQRVVVNTSPEKTYTRVSIDHDHPRPLFLDRTVSDPSRWLQVVEPFRSDANSEGPVLVVGMGDKSHKHLNEYSWERRALVLAQKRFPDRKIIYRPKPRSKHAEVPDEKNVVPWPNTVGGLIEEALRGVSLVICKHSNVAVDACIAGVPVECEDGAALWLYRHGSAPTVAQRLDFLHRLCWWQWRFFEMQAAWEFLLGVLDETRFVDRKSGQDLG
jgi:hypothetical protein